MKKLSLPLIALAATLPAVCPAANELTVTAVNKLPIERQHQTIELTAKQLAPLGETDLKKIHVQDAAGQQLLCQAVDTDYDPYHTPDTVIFQTDFAPEQTKTFTVTVGRTWAYQKYDFKAYGRFVRERFDDFAWENDRIAHRTYGKALETWKGEPLTSSAIDIWSKRTPRLVINNWYMLGDAYYHADHGQGCDDYTAGTTRGDGGNGLWANDKLWVSKNFVNSHELANGPIRVMFELDYEPFNVNGMMVSEVKRITLDAGSQMDHYISYYKIVSGHGSLVSGIGLKTVKREQEHFARKLGVMAFWEPMERHLGMQGVAAIVDPNALVKQTADRQNNLLLVNVGPDHAVSYWAGFAWNRAGIITTRKAWNKYVDDFARGLLSPIAVSVSAK